MLAAVLPKRRIWSRDRADILLEHHSEMIRNIRGGVCGTVHAQMDKGGAWDERARTAVRVCGAATTTS